MREAPGLGSLAMHEASRFGSLTTHEAPGLRSLAMHEAPRFGSLTTHEAPGLGSLVMSEATGLGSLVMRESLWMSQQGKLVWAFRVTRIKLLISLYADH